MGKGSGKICVVSVCRATYGNSRIEKLAFHAISKQKISHHRVAESKKSLDRLYVNKVYLRRFNFPRESLR